MALASRIKVTTVTAGTGTLTLSATGVRDAVNGDCMAPAERLSRIGHKMLSYYITSGAKFAFGMGELSADGLTLVRDNDEKSWDGTTFATTKLNLAGTSTVLIAGRGEDYNASNVGKTIAARIGAYLC